MATIVPAILPTSRKDLEEKLEQLVGIATEVQVDVVDGIFARPPSWPYGHGTHEFALAVDEGETLPHVDALQLEVDLMVMNPEQVTGLWLSAGATRILAHFEATTYLPQLITDLRVRYGHEKGSELLAFGLAVNLDTDLMLLDPFLEDVDYVQFMGIKEIGKQGQPFSTMVLNRIAVFRKEHPDIPIQVDGGVNLESAPLLIQAGVSRLVIGSALWKAPNLKDAFAQFAELDAEHGWFA